MKLILVSLDRTTSPNVNLTLNPVFFPLLAVLINVFPHQRWPIAALLVVLSNVFPHQKWPIAVFAGKFFPTQPGRISSDVIIVRPEPALRAEVEGKHAEDRNASSADSPMAQDSQPHPLFAGAFSAVLPPFSQDVSELREIPDNQEVFAHNATDQSIIVELLEYQEGVSDSDAARYHFEDVASSNDAEGQSEVLSVEPLPLAQLTLTACTNAWVLTGHQLVAKFNEEARNAVTIHMALFRLPQHSTDMLVTFNDPAAINPSSSSAVGGASLAPLSPWTLADFNRLLCTLQLHNPSIFG
eukprot:XP_002941865.2 PREDICTED: ran guanine nucleotide release factor isoform X1 [Xenopus tropicalis]